MWFAVMIAGLTAYMLGNLNGAVCVSALVADDDVRKHGSGNAGLTNFIRNYGAKNAALVVIVDGGKAVLACVSAGLILAPYGYWLEGLTLGGAAVILGHTYPALLGFRGGKGILSGFMIAVVIDWRIGVIILLIFAAAYLLTGYVSLGSVLGAIGFGIGFVIFYSHQPLVLAGGLLMCGLAVFMHRGNIARLLKGQERKTNLFSKGKEE